MLKDLSRHGRMAVREVYWTTNEPVATIARRYGVTEDEVEGLAHWKLFPIDGVPAWARPGKERGSKRGSLADLFAPLLESVEPVTASVSSDENGLSDEDIAELRETLVLDPGILDSIAEAFELPRDRVIRLLKGEDHPEVAGPVYSDLGVDALTVAA